MEALDWQAHAEAASDAVAEALAPRLKKATDDLYGDLLCTVQDYLKENVLHNVQAEIDAANRQALHDRQRATKAEANVTALLEALKDTLASLTAAISTLERSPKTAAASDKMFDLMLADYRKSADRARQAISQALGGE